jgi:hypothetical protein
MQELQQLGVRLWLDERGAHAEPAERLPLELREELRRLKSEVIEFLAEQGESIVDPDAIVLNNTPPRSAAEVDADARKAQAAAAQRRQYQNGMVVVHNHDGLTGDRGRNGFARHVELLVRERNHRAAVEAGEIPPEGRYRTRFDVFG